MLSQLFCLQSHVVAKIISGFKNDNNIFCILWLQFFLMWASTFILIMDNCYASLLLSIHTLSVLFQTYPGNFQGSIHDAIISSSYILLGISSQVLEQSLKVAFMEEILYWIVHRKALE
jgi:hypothetical protein